MPLEVIIANRQKTIKVDARLLKKIVLACFEKMEIGDAELGIQLVSGKEMGRINWEFLRHQGSTDVITFDHRDGTDGIDAESKGNKCLGKEARRVYGEMFICVDDAVAQAKGFKTTWQAEVVRYVIHGLLHLLGYGDLEPGARHKMKREENRMLRRLERCFEFGKLKAK